MLFLSAVEKNGALLSEACKEYTRQRQEASQMQERLKKIERLLSDLDKFKTDNWPLHIAATCRAAANEIEYIKATNDALHGHIHEVYLAAEACEPEVLRELPTTIDREALSQGVELDRVRSCHPRYFFAKHGLIEVLIDERKKTASISTRAGKLAQIPADPNAIVRHAACEAERIYAKRSSSKVFLQDLWRSYHACLRKHRRTDGDPVPVRDMYESLSTDKKRPNYKMDEFIVDLSELAHEALLETKGFRLELQQTRDTKDGILLVGPAELGYVNLVTFVKLEKPA